MTISRDSALPYPGCVPNECAVASPFWGSIPELIEVVTLAQRGPIAMLVEHFPLDRAPEVYQLLSDGNIRGRGRYHPQLSAC